MNRQDAMDATREALIAAEALAAHVLRLRERLRPMLPLVAQAYRADEDVERLHAFLRFFEQLHDLIGRKLFRGAITIVDEDASALSAKALVLRLEQIEAIASRRDWLTLSEVRNRLVHDYPVTAEAFADHVNAAEGSLDLLLGTLRRLGDFLRREGLFS